MIKWEENYSVGIQSIDNQHKEIFKFLNKLLEALKQGKASSVTMQIIQDLEQYAIMHFHKEEFFFQRFNFSGAAKHIAVHQFFTQKVADLKADLKAGKVTIAFELLNFLKDWIEHHILEEDKKYSELFRQNGLK